VTSLFFPNFGAEERDDPPPSSWTAPVLAHLDEAFRAACGGGRAFDDATGVVAWLNTPRAAQEAHARGLPLFGASPAVVDVVHDKGFCAGVVAASGLLPRSLVGAVHVVDVGDVTAEGLLRSAQLPSTSSGLPHRGFTAKPRRGTSGRGRVDLRRADALPGALPRLRAAGGVVVEPWLERAVDLATAWRVRDDGTLVFLGSSLALVNGGGVWRGCTMVVDDDGVPRAPSRWEPLACEQSRVVVQAAAARGYRGPCGVDAFAFVDVDGGEALRVVELNARFTAGVVSVALARGAPPGTRVAFSPAQGAGIFVLGDNRELCPGNG
jgi:hypothetical protein